MKIYLTRHGETEWNRERRTQGWKNSNLTRKGIESAKRLGNSLKNIDFACIYSSPLGRALDTAKHIRGDRDIGIKINDSLKEMGFGAWEGMIDTEIQEQYPEELHNYWNEPHLFEPVGGESYDELINRVRRVLDNIISSSPGENVLVVTHAAVIKAIYVIIKNTSLENFWDMPYVYGTCLSIIEVTGKETRFTLEADISHLDIEESYEFE